MTAFRAELDRLKGHPRRPFWKHLPTFSFTLGVLILLVNPLGVAFSLAEGRYLIAFWQALFVLTYPSYLSEMNRRVQLERALRLPKVQLRRVVS